MTRRVLKTSDGIMLTENTLSDGNNILNRTYSVTARGVLQPSTFQTLGEAENQFEQEVLRALNPKPANHPPGS